MGHPSPPAPPPQAPGLTPGGNAAVLLPTAKANTAAKLGGGISPEFLSQVINRQQGDTGGTSILSQIRGSLGP